MDLGVTGRTAVVLGSTSGLGKAIAETLAKEGANIVVVGRNAERGRSVAATLPSAIAVAADVTVEGAQSRIWEVTTNEFAAPDILILNGGGPAPGRALEFDASNGSKSFELLVGSYISMVNLCLPSMFEKGWGRIIAIGSSGIKQPIDNLVSSNVGRAALAGYLKTLANELAASGVTVNMVLPGRIATERVDNLDKHKARQRGKQLDEVVKESQASIPLGRYGTPDEFAATVAFLSGVQASYITGEQIRCDGGLIRAF